MQCFRKQCHTFRKHKTVYYIEKHCSKHDSLFKVKSNYLEKHRKIIMLVLILCIKVTLDSINPRRPKHSNNVRTLMKFLAFPCVGSEAALFMFEYEEIYAIYFQKKFETP